MIVGTAVAAGDPQAVWWRAMPALLVSLALQVGVNYANDYSDGVRGTDDVRIGPARLVGSGLASASSVKRAAFACFGVAGVAGLALAAATSWWLLAVGVAAILAAWFYTGGPHPYGYIGLGEVFVFVFFGLVATVGTTYVVIEQLPAATVWLGCGVGALACALLVVNNLRDIPTDAAVGKRTLAVRLGDRRTRWMYVGLCLVAGVCVLVVALDRPAVLVALGAAVAAVRPLRAVLAGSSGSALIPVLAGTGQVQLIYGLLASAGLLISRI